MNTYPLILKKLNLRRMPGLPDGLKPLEDLSPQINLVTGPNASGKSSTARAIRQLIWPASGLSFDIQGSFEAEGEKWELRFDHGHYSSQRNGVDDRLAGLPAADESARYEFALQELVHVDDREIAAKVYAESMGGFNLDKAYKALGYSSGIRNKQVTQSRDMVDADRELHRIENEQISLRSRFDKLESLRSERERVRDAVKLASFCEAVISCLEATCAKDEAYARLRDLPKELAEMLESDYQDIVDHENTVQTGETAIEENNNEISGKRSDVEKLTLPEDGVGTLVFREAQERIDTLTTLEQNLERNRVDLADAKKRVDDLLAAIARKDDDVKDITVDPGVIHELDQFIEEAHRLLSKQRILEVSIAALQDSTAQDPKNSDKTRQAIQVLLNWFASHREQSGVKTIWLWIMLLVASVVTVLAVIFAWYALICLPLMVALIIVASRNKGDSEASMRQNDFARTDLTPPEKWEKDVVFQKLEELNCDMQLDERRQELGREKARLERELGDMQPSLEQLSSKRAEFLENIGHAPELPDGDLQSYSDFYWYMKQLLEYAGARNEHTALLAEGKAWEAEHAEQLKKLNEVVKGLVSPVADVAAARAALQDLREREELRRNLENEISSLVTLNREKAGQIEHANRKIGEIYTRIGAAEHDKLKIYQLTQQLPDYREAMKNCQSADVLLADAIRRRDNHTHGDQFLHEIKDLPLDQLKEKLADQRRLADKLEKLSDDIKEIETLSESEMQGTKLEDALREHGDALEALSNLYAGNLHSFTGDLLVRHLQQDKTSQNASAVLQRANTIFNQITNGRYELRINNGLDFSAYDHQSGQGQGLPELSAGTRIQLLLAVRLAYIESQEKGVALPILADELLANSDDQRAAQIVSALATMAQNGRQVFYFTAREDEMQKFTALKDVHPGLIIKTYHIRPRDARESTDWLIQGEPQMVKLYANVPPSAGLTKAQYEQLIGVPGFNLITHQPEQLPLWYLLDDMGILEQCLKQNIAAYGQLESFLNYGGKIPGITGQLLANLKVKIAILGLYQQLYRIGRPRPIDRQVLVDSQCVSANYLTQAYELLGEVENDPVRLVSKLRNGAISGFRSNKIDGLEAYLEDKGFISDDDILGDTGIAMRLSAELGFRGLSIEEAQPFLDEFIAIR